MEQHVVWKDLFNGKFERSFTKRMIAPDKMEVAFWTR